MDDTIKYSPTERREKKILKSAIEPPSKEWLWLHTVEGRPVLSEHVNGKWREISAVSIGPNDIDPSTITPVTPGGQQPSQQQDIDLSDYVTTGAMEAALTKYVTNTSLAAKLRNYVLREEVEITLKKSNKPIAAAPVYNAVTTINNNITQINDTLANKQDKLEAGNGIEIDGNVISVNVTGTQGYSAYEIAVQNGFHGSEAAWLESLHGQSGGTGIQDIQQTVVSTEPGGENVVTIMLTDGTSESFSIYNGTRGPAGYSISESIGSGIFQRALDQANLTPDTMFQWILIDTDDDNNPVKKVIWHIGQGNFIDANGSPMTQEE